MSTDSQYIKAIQAAKADGNTEAADELRAAWHAQNTKPVDPLEGTSTAQRLAINLGAGFDTAYQGAKQLLGRGMTEEQLQEKRRLDEAAANSVTGGSLAQGVGEFLPGVALGGGAGQLVARSLPRVAMALANAGRLKKAAGLGAAGGVVDANLRPYAEDESRLANTAGSALLGAALGPVATKTLDAGGNVVRAVGGRFNNKIAEAQGRHTAENLVNRELGDEVGSVAQSIANAPRRTLPLSAAATSNDPRLAKLEVANRRSLPEVWAEHDDAFLRGVSGSLDTATAVGNAADAMAAARTSAYSDLMDDVVKGASLAPKKFAGGVGAAQKNVRDALAGSSYGGKAGKVISEIDRAFEGETGIKKAIQRGDTDVAARQLMELRTELSTGAGRFANMGEAQGEAGRKMMKIAIDEIDNVLDNAVHGNMAGRLTKANQGFAAASPDVDAAQLAQALRAKVAARPVNAVGAGPTPQMSYDVKQPLVAEMRTKALEEAQKGSPIARTMANRLTNIEDEFALANRASGSRVGEIDPEIRTPYAPGIAGHAIRAAVDWLRGMSARDRDRVLAEALRDPAKMQELLQSAQARRTALGSTRRFLSSGVGAAFAED